MIVEVIEIVINAIKNTISVIPCLLKHDWEKIDSRFWDYKCRRCGEYK